MAASAIEVHDMARLLLEQDEALISASTFKSSLDHQAYKKCRTALVCLKAAKPSNALSERSFYRITRRCILEAKARSAGGGDAFAELSVSARMSHPEQVGSVHHVLSDLEGDTVTCLSFNPFPPCLLAVGTGSGSVSLFDAAAPRPVRCGVQRCSVAFIISFNKIYSYRDMPKPVVICKKCVFNMHAQTIIFDSHARF
jgi:hypothetical protein